MKMDIFPDRSQDARDILLTTDLRKVLIVPIDFAKKSHVVQLVRGNGKYLKRRPLNIDNNSQGCQHLMEQVERCCAKYRIPKCNVLFGGEDPPEYVWNFILPIQMAGYTFVRVNAKEAKKHRTNTRAVSDTLALDGIAQVMMLNRSYDLRLRDELFGTMKMAERARRKLKKQETALKNRIHQDAFPLFPGLLSESESGLTPFGASCLNLMLRGCSVGRVKRMRTDTLARLLKEGRTRKAEEVAIRLKALANSALPPDPGIVLYLEKSLAAKARHMMTLRENLRLEENEMARCLVQTPGFLLTSIPGLGVVLAGGIVAEYGDTTRWRAPDNMASYAGIVCREHQTGGPDVAPVKGRLPIDANHHLKDQLLQATYHVGHNTHPAWRLLGLPGERRLLENYRDVELREGRSRLSTAKKLLKVAVAMVRDERIYLPHNALDPTVPDAMPAEQFVAYHRIVAEMLARKWKGYDLSGIPEECNRLRMFLKEADTLAKHSQNKNK